MALETFFQQGNAVKAVPVANGALAALVALLLLSAQRWPGIAAHLYAMVFLAGGLLASLNWVAAELRRDAKRS